MFLMVLQLIESTQELGNDLAGVMALQRKLTGMERDLVAIEDKMGDLGKEAERLASEHPEQSEAIKGRLAEITGVWQEMKVGGLRRLEFCSVFCFCFGSGLSFSTY